MAHCIVDSVITPATSTGDGITGSHTWNISSELAAGTDYRVRITSTAASRYTDSNDKGFTSTNAAAIIVASPNGGEIFQAGTTLTIRWTYAGIPGTAVKTNCWKEDS
jgi:hypothetical protein